MDKREEHYEKVKTILKSCENRFHLKTAVKIINQFLKQYQIGEDDREYTHLNKILGLMKVKCGVGKEERLEESNKYKQIGEENSVSKDFKNYLGTSGVPELKSIKVEQDQIEGGLADNKTLKDLAKKHNVKVKDIKKQIEKGIEVEREHTDSDKVAKEIAMDHEDEFPNYYDALEDMEKDMEMEGELDEATAGGSAGGYEGLFSTKTVKQKLHKPKVPVAKAGGIRKPIGKMHSFRRNESKTYTKSQLKESNVFSKGEIMNEAMDSSSNVEYDTTAFAPSKFWGNAGKKGKVPVRKGKDHKKTYDYDTGSSTFARIKPGCNKMNTPNCEEGAGSVEYSKTPFKEGLKDKLPTKEGIKESWRKFVGVAKREGKESVEAAKILKKVLVKEETTENEIQFLKEQSGDILKMLSVVAMGAVSTALPILVEKALNKKGISILPKERMDTLVNGTETEQLVESICKKTGKSKKYVHSLIKRYL